MGPARVTTIDALKTRDTNHNKAYIKGKLCSAFNSLLIFVLEKVAGIWDPFKSAMMQVGTCEKVVLYIDGLLVNYSAALDPTAKFAVEKVRSEAFILIEKPVFVASPSYLASGSDILSNEKKKKRRKC